MQISVSSLGDGAGRSPVDTCVQELGQMRDERFRRMWMTQFPWQTDRLTALAVALREVDGRLTLGLGMSHRTVTQGMWGIPWDKPVRLLGEYWDGLLPLLAGERADAVRETVSTRGVLRIPGAAAPKVRIAALGPQMLRLAGRRSAGTVTWTGPKTLVGHIGPTLRDAAAAGRPDGAVSVAAVLPICVTDDVDRARAQAAEQFAMYGRRKDRVRKNRRAARRPGRRVHRNALRHLHRGPRPFTRPPAGCDSTPPFRPDTDRGPP